MLLHRLQEDSVLLRSFRTWEEVMAFMRCSDSPDTRKNGVLLPIFQRHAEDNDPRWRTILLLIFWPALKSLCVQKRTLEPEYRELWANVVQAFFDAVCCLDVARWNDQMAARLFSETLHGIVAAYSKERRRSGREVSTDPTALAALAGDTNHSDFSEAGESASLAAAVGWLRAYVEAGSIDETDFCLLVGSIIYGKTDRECAEETGLSCQAAKKRRQRAITAIRAQERQK